jgi:PEP-CTERM motif
MVLVDQGDRMTKNTRYVLGATVALACAMGASSPANAAFFATICNDIQCTGGDDFIVQDNGPGDTIGATGAINFATSAFGYTLLVNTSQSKPMLGSDTAPQLDLTFSATSGAVAPAGSVFLYVSDTDFLSGSSFVLTLGGTNSGGSGTETGRAWGGTSNTALLFSGANLFGSLVGLTGTPYSGSVAGAFTPAVTPFSLTMGVAITRSTAGTSTGDLNLQISPVPEPSTWALMLVGPAFIGFVALRRRRL